MGNAVTCEECQEGAAGLVDHLLTEESLAEQGSFLKALVCPQLDDVAACEANVDMWFPDMPAASTTTSSLREMSAAGLDSARRLPSSPRVTGPAKSAPMFLPEPLHTWLMKPPLPRQLSTSREIASVARMDTLMIAPTLSPPLLLLPCQFLPR